MHVSEGVPSVLDLDGVSEALVLIGDAVDDADGEPVHAVAALFPVKDGVVVNGDGQRQAALDGIDAVLKVARDKADKLAASAEVNRSWAADLSAVCVRYTDELTEVKAYLRALYAGEAPLSEFGAKFAALISFSDELLSFGPPPDSTGDADWKTVTTSLADVGRLVATPTRVTQKDTVQLAALAEIAGTALQNLGAGDCAVMVG